ncbi:MAG TPA: cytochrome c peroxidase [Bacteroidia bacterium]|nr:cytochrome c peroxidase [Bacteroidia bacterium]
MKKSFLAILFSLLSLVLLFSFIDNGSYFLITKQDVAFKKLKGFPKPLYDLEKNKPTPEGFMLGRKLFYDPILSKDNTVSCATCHQQFAAFAQTDHSFSHGVNGAFGKRNAPALQNLIWRDAFMVDGGINHLDLQPIAPITNPLEMNEDLASVLKKLQQNKEYVALFKAVYNDSIISSNHFLKSLSQFLSLLISADSRYDRYKRGKDTLTKSELNGLKLFRTNCSSCHAEPLFTDNSYRSNGIGINPVIKDSGRFLISRLPNDLMKFKVPSLRNIEVSYPYMHDGRFYSLKQVLNHYSKISSSKNEVDPILKNMPTLNEQEQKDIIAFLKTLTDKAFLHDKRFMDPGTHVYFPKPIMKTETKIVPKINESIIAKYKTEWESVTLTTIDGIPQYISYMDKLDEITQNISKQIKNQKNIELENLRSEFLDSKKHKEAIKNYIIFGQPTSKDEIIEPCKQQLKSNINDADIIDTKLNGQSKKGWLVLIKYKAKNKSGDIVVKTTSFDIKYNPIEKNYVVLKAN